MGTQKTECYRSLQKCFTENIQSSAILGSYGKTVGDPAKNITPSFLTEPSSVQVSSRFLRRQFYTKLVVVVFSRSVMSDSLWPHGLQHARLACPLPSPRACSNSCLLSWWCHPTISSSVVPFSSRLLHFPASRSFPISSSHQVAKVLDQGNESNLFWPVRVIPFPLPIMV